jgi:hypothetical protein
MRTLTKNQIARLESAIGLIDSLVADRPVDIADEGELAVIVDVFATIAQLLAAGQTISVSVSDERGSVVATTPIRLEPAAA